jgi:hypothetical protein
MRGEIISPPIFFVYRASFYSQNAKEKGIYLVVSIFLCKFAVLFNFILFFNSIYYV